MGRSGLRFTTQPTAGDTGNGLYIQGGTVNITGDLAMATVTESEFERFRRASTAAA